jgi:hypothetical protein
MADQIWPGPPDPFRSGQVVTITMDLHALDDSWIRGGLGTWLYGSSGRGDGEIVSVWCDRGGTKVSLGRLVAYHVTASAPFESDCRVFGDAELSEHLLEDSVLGLMFAALVSWIIAFESEDHQTVIVWSSNFAVDVGHELIEDERQSLPDAVSQLGLQSNLRYLDIDSQQKLQFRFQQVAAYGEKISCYFVGGQAWLQCGPRLKQLAKLIEE